MSTQDLWLELGSLFLNIILIRALSEMNKHITHIIFLIVIYFKKALRKIFLVLCQELTVKKFLQIGSLFLSSVLKG